MVLEQLGKEQAVELLKLQHAQWVSSVVWPSHDKKGAMYKAHFNKGAEIYKKLQGIILSLDEKSELRAYADEMASLRAEYTKKFGDPSSPENKARSAADAEALRKQEQLSKQKASLEAKQFEERAQAIERLRRKRYRR